MGDHSSTKRIMSGEVENAGKRGPRGEGEIMDGLRGRGSSGNSHHGELEYRRTINTRPWGLLQHSMRRGL